MKKLYAGLVIVTAVLLFWPTVSMAHSGSFIEFGTDGFAFRFGAPLVFHDHHRPVVIHHDRRPIVIHDHRFDRRFDHRFDRRFDRRFDDRRFDDRRHRSDRRFDGGGRRGRH